PARWRPPSPEARSPWSRAALRSRARMPCTSRRRPRSLACAARNSSFVRATARRSGQPPLGPGLLLAGALAASCAAPAPPPPAQGAAAPSTRADLIVLLPGRDGVGAIVVQEGGRELALTAAYAKAETGADGRLAPGQATPEEVRSIFAEAVAAEPPR